MKNKLLAFALMGMHVDLARLGVKAIGLGPNFVCPAPVTVTVTKTVDNTSARFMSTKPASAVATTVTQADSTETVMETVTDVITVIGPTASVKDGTGTSKKSVHVVTVVDTIWVTPSGPGSATVPVLRSTSSDVTTTETRFSTETITIEESTFGASATFHVPPKPHSSTGTMAPYGNGTTSAARNGTGFSTLAASTGNSSHIVLSVTAPRPHSHHHLTISTGRVNGSHVGHHSMTVSTSAPMSTSAAAGKGNESLTVTLPRMPHTSAYHRITVAHFKNSSCTESATGHLNSTRISMHEHTTLASSSRSMRVNSTKVVTRSSSMLDSSNSKALSSTTASMNSSSSLPTLVTTGISSFPMASPPPGVTPATVHTTSSGTLSTIIAKRSEDDVVYATINGQRVSWINNYTPSSASTQDPETTWTFPTPKMPIPVSALESYRISNPAPASVTSSITNSYGSFTLGSLPPTQTPRGGSSAPSQTSGAPAADCSATELGNFVIGFDDLPTYGEPANKTIYPPLPARYHHLYWSEGYSYVPPPSDPFPPHSGHQLGVFIVDHKANVHSEDEPTIFMSPGLLSQPAYKNGMFGSGPNFRNSAYWFDVHNVWFGCHYTGDTKCHVAAFGWKYNETSGHIVPGPAQYFFLPMCQGKKKCSLHNLEFSAEFKNLTIFQLKALSLIKEKPVTFYLDDLELQWSNDTCTANAIRNGDL